MIKSELTPGKKVFIEGDEFMVVCKTDKRKSTGCYEYLLNPLNEEILSAKIHYKNAKNILFEISRVIDCQIKGRSIQYKGEVFQISKQYDDVYFNEVEDRMVRDHVYELLKLKEGMLNNIGPRRIVVGFDKKKIFYDFRELTMNEFSHENNSKENLEGRKETISFTYKFKEPVG